MNNEQAPDRIWLIDMGDCVCWHDEPNPMGQDDDEKPDVVEYVRADSLTRRDAQTAASELELFAAGIRAQNEEGATADLFGMARLLDTRAGQLRQQAEEPES